jgi:pescadillo protein
VKKLNKKDELLKKQRELFGKCNFLLNRETPIYCLQYLILSFGGQYLTDDDYENGEESKMRVTHHVMDRPLAGKLETNREYVQP